MGVPSRFKSEAASSGDKGGHESTLVDGYQFTGFSRYGTDFTEAQMCPFYLFPIYSIR
jgi:hypothetical protein